MSFPDYTVVCGVDCKHLEQLAITWPTWKRHKPSLLEHPMLIFFDWQDGDVNSTDVLAVVDHPNLELRPWPVEPIGRWTGPEYWGDPNGGKWTDPQRHKMLAGFVYMSRFLSTPYWLKIDTDVVATGQDDWIGPEWFRRVPAIVSHRWGYTKPPDQMDKLDGWAEENREAVQQAILPYNIVDCSPLNLHPEPGENKIKHPRIISFVGFFNTDFTQMCAKMAEATCKPNQLPVPSQDGYAWYCATRMGLSVVRANLKKRGWQQWNSMDSVRKAAEEAMNG